MLERYLTTNGFDEYVDVDCVREALGIKEDENIFLAIKKLKEERDELEDRVRTYRFIANGTYGDSCGYSGDKKPAFFCNVISYSWNSGALDTPFSSQSIRVELDLTPTANYKGTFDMEDLKRYIQNYGREKKLGIVESIDYQNAKAARAELAHLYKTVLGKEKLDRDLSPHEVMKAIHDEYKRVRDSQLAFSQCLRSVYMNVCDGPDCKVSDIYAAPDKLADEIITRYNSTKKLSDFEVFCKLVDNCIDELCDSYNVVQPDSNKTTRERLDYIFSVLADYREMHNTEWKRVEGLKKDKQALSDSLAELRAKVREIYRSVVDDEWDESLSHTSALNDINEEYKRVVHNFEERTADWSKAQQEYSCCRLAVDALKETLGAEEDEDIFSIINGDRRDLNNLIQFRKDAASALGMSCLSARQDILDRIGKLNESAGHDKLFRDSVCDALDTTTAVSDSYLFKNIEKLKLDHKEIQEKYSRYCLAVGSLCNIPAEHREDISWIEDAFNHTKKDYLKWQATADRLARLRSDICTALCLGGETCDGNIIGRIHMMQDCHDKLTVFRNDVAVAIGMATKDRNSDILKRVRMTKECHDKLCKDYTEFKDGEELLIEFRDDVAKAIGITYPTTNNFILKRVADIYKDRGEAHDLAMELDKKCIDLTAKNSELESKYKEQYRLRQCWHTRYDSEHERANGVQKALDREKEKCRVKDISLETAKKQYEKVCGNLETAECALNGMKSKIRGLQEEKTKVITALGQDIWDDCLK